MLTYDGWGPVADLVMDQLGNLYGTTEFGGAFGGGFGDGTVFQLMPPATSGGSWTESVIWNFGNGADGFTPIAGLLIDKKGDLFGTTFAGGSIGGGTLFELRAPATTGANRTEAILWNFGGRGDGQAPEAGVIIDPRGNLYGTTFNGGATGWGTVFELSPPATGLANWTESILFDFGVNGSGNDPMAGLLLDAKGILFGTTYRGGTQSANGTVFEISNLGNPTPTPTP